MFQIRVKCFAKSRDLVGTSEILIQVDKLELTADEFLDLLIKKYPK